MRLEVSLAAAAVAAVFLLLQGTRALAVEPLTPQQQRMRVCNTQADGKKLRGGERNHFIRACLKGAGGDGHRMTPRQKQNQACNEQAKQQGLEGAERRGFMSECTKPAVAQQRPDKEKEKRCRRGAEERGLTGDERSSYINGCRSASAAAG